MIPLLIFEFMGKDTQNGGEVKDRLRNTFKSFCEIQLTTFWEILLKSRIPVGFDIFPLRIFELIGKNTQDDGGEVKAELIQWVREQCILPCHLSILTH